ncbi:Putative G-protein coupled receptor 142 [Myotis brandtii]|uniref:Putative G-protein coupled receptor 142 n=1 Tax=Myotis brandtii TaxID=109478 RepID=S7MLF5_MYOBR|nr:Putative G-protein coupled receptor 142 [Myotis brandtii]
MLPTPNGSGPSPELEGHWPETSERSPCVAGVIPTIYYSILLSLGLPVALARLAARTRKPVYYYLLALTASDIVTQVVIVFVGFLLQGAVLARDLPRSVAHTVNILEFAATGRARRDISIVLGAALLTGIPFYWWLDVWRDPGPPSTLDEALKWAHCLTVYFIPGGITAILLGLTTLFTCLWAPRIFVMLYHLYIAPVHRDWRVHLALDVANMVAMLHTVVNFGLYCFVSKTFRATIREVVHDAHLPCILGPQPEGTVAEPVLKPPGLPEGAEL